MFLTQVRAQTPLRLLTCVDTATAGEGGVHARAAVGVPGPVLDVDDLGQQAAVGDLPLTGVGLAGDPVVVGRGCDVEDPEEGSIPKRPRSSLTSVMTVAGSGRVLVRKNADRFEYLVGSAQLSDLFTQPADLLGLSGRRPVVAFTVVCLVLTDPVPQRFGCTPNC
jgi:hypothetical protein